MKCGECNGTREYIGLNVREACKACGGERTMSQTLRCVTGDSVGMTHGAMKISLGDTSGAPPVVHVRMVATSAELGDEFRALIARRQIAEARAKRAPPETGPTHHYYWVQDGGGEWRPCSREEHDAAPAIRRWKQVCPGGPFCELCS